MGATPTADKPLTDRLLRSWVRCRRRAWLDRHADPKDRLYTAHRTLQLDDQQRSFMALLPGKPGHGLKACERGDAGVVGLRLRGFLQNDSLLEGVALEAHPPLLQRVNGSSHWGGFAYRPVIARQGRRLTREHRLPLALAGRLLATFQSSEVPEALAVARSGRGLELERLPLGISLHRQLDESLLRLLRDLKRVDPPPLAADRRKCMLCSWRGLCNDVASEQGHLSEVSGIGAKRREMLHEIGVNSLHALAAANPQELGGKLKRFGEQHAAMGASLVSQARVQRDGVVERLDTLPALPELVNAPGVLLYDIESDPDARDDFLHGFVRLPHDRDNGWDLTRASYHPLLVLQEHGEKRCWLRLQRFLATYPDWRILHYGETESLALLRMAKRQRASMLEQQALKERLIDVHARLRAHWQLPLNNYGLKAVAGWRGFKWRQSGVDGARALLWWRQWRGDGVDARGSSNALRWILNYNRDDGLATWSVAYWLLSSDQRMTDAREGGSEKARGLNI